MPESESPNDCGVSSSRDPTSTAKITSAPSDFMCDTVRLSTYPPSNNMLPSSHSGGNSPASDIDARTYRHAYPLVWNSALDLEIFVVLQ